MALIAYKYAGNPVVVVPDISWSNRYPEHPQVLPVGSGGHYVFHMYFHAGATLADYKIGHAVARSPFDPWKVDSAVLLDVGAPGAWDSMYTATPCVLEIGGTYYMWYAGHDGASIRSGLATASSPYGPFTKDPGNPFADLAQWVGQVVHVDGTYYMLCGSEKAQDIYTASDPAGPWTWLSRPFGVAGGDAWNSKGTMGESGLVYVEGRFYMFMCGRNYDPVPLDFALKRPYNIGAAVSDDCVTWTQYPNNPIISRTGAPGYGDAYDGWRISELSVFHSGDGLGRSMESDTFYLFYTSVGPSDTLPADETLSVSVVKREPLNL